MRFSLAWKKAGLEKLKAILLKDDERSLKSCLAFASFMNSKTNAKIVFPPNACKNCGKQIINRNYGKGFPY